MYSVLLGVIAIKILGQMLKWRFLLSRSHFGRYSGFSSKIGRIPTRSEWLDSLHRHATFYVVIYHTDKDWSILYHEKLNCSLSVKLQKNTEHALDASSLTTSNISSQIGDTKFVLSC